MSMRNFLSGLILASALLIGAAAQAAEAPPEKAFAAKGEQTCLKCHVEAPAINILDTVHAVKGDERTPFAEHGCEGCHGASPEHSASAAKVTNSEIPKMRKAAMDPSRQPLTLAKPIANASHNYRRTYYFQIVAIHRVSRPKVLPR